MHSEIDIAHSVTMSDMHTDLIKMLQESIELAAEVKVNKKLCSRLVSKMQDMLNAVQNLQRSNIMLSPVIYHNLISLLLDVKAFLKKSAVKSLLGNFQKSKIQNEFNTLNQRLTNIMMDEPRLLPDNATEAARSRQAPPLNERKTLSTGHSTKRLMTQTASTSPFLMDDSIIYSTKLTCDEMSHWLMGSTGLAWSVVSAYAALLQASGLNNLTALQRTNCAEPLVLMKLGFSAEHAGDIAHAIQRAVDRRPSEPSGEDGPLPSYEMALLDESVSSPAGGKGGQLAGSPAGGHGEALMSASSRQLLVLTVDSSLSALTTALTQCDPHLAVAALEGVADMAEGSEENQRAYGSAGACDIVVLLLVEMSWSEAVCEAGLRAVCWLSRYGTGRHTSSARNISLLGDAGACRAVVTAIDVHAESEDILFWGCRAIMNLSSNVQNNMRLGEDGACVTVVGALSRCGERTGLQKNHEIDGGDFSLQIWGALINISLTPLNNAKLAEAGAADAVITVWRSSVSCRNIALWACMATQNLALNDESKEALGQGGGCALVVDALRRFSVDSEVAAQAFMAIQNLTNNHASNNTALGEAGACHTVVEVLQEHINDEAVAQRGCMALMNLSHNHDRNREVLVAQGVCRVISDALKLHPDSASVAEFAFGVVVNLTDADWRVFHDHPSSHHENAPAAALSSSSCDLSDLCDNLITVLQSHCEDTNCEVVAELGCWAIRNLCFANMENKTLMGTIGAAEVVCKCLSTHMGSVAVAEMACWSIAVLAEGDHSNSYRLGTAGACADVVRLLQLQCHVDSVVELGCMAIQSLALSCERNRRLLADLDAYAIVMKAVKEHYAKEHIETLGLRTLSSLSRHDEVEKAVLSIANTHVYAPYSRETSPSAGTFVCLEEKPTRTQRVECGNSEDVGPVVRECADMEEVECAMQFQRRGGMDDENAYCDDGDDYPHRTGSMDSDVVMRVNSFRGHHDSCQPESLSSKNWDDKILGFSARATVDVDEALAALRAACSDENQSEMFAAAALSLSARLAEGRGGLLQKSLGQGGACELIGQIMEPMLSSETVCRHGLEAICWMSRYGTGKETSNEENVQALGAAGLCEIVVAAGSLHYANDIQQGSELCLWCCRAITNLAANEVNSVKLGKTGACGVVLAILCSHYEIVVAQSKQGSYLGTGNLMDVVKQGWGAVINLALTEENNVRFGKEGGCECVVQYMEIWRMTPVDILMFLLIGVQNLALIELNRDKLTSTAVCSLIVDVLALYVEKIGLKVGVESILEYGCMAIQKLALNRVHSDCIGEHGGCKVVITILSRLPDHLGIQELGGLAVMNLSSESTDNVLRLVESEAFACLNQSICNFTDVTGGEPVVEYALTALNNIARTCDVHAREIMTDTCMESVVGAIKVCYRRAKGSPDVMSNSLVMQQGCLLIRKLSDEEQTRNCLMAFGAGNVLSKIIREFQDGSPELSTVARSTLKSLLRGAAPVVPKCQTEKGDEGSDSHVSPPPSVNALEDPVELLESERHLPLMLSPHLPPPSGDLWLNSSSRRDDDTMEVSVVEAVDSLRQALHVTNNDMAVASCLFRVSRMAEGSAENQSEFGSLGCCIDVVRALGAYTSSNIVCENGLRAVCFLSRYGQDKSTANDYNNSVFGELELPELLVRVMNNWQDNEKVCFFGCKAIMNLGSNDVLNAILGEVGACVAVVTTIETFFQVDNLLKQGLWALINLALNDHNNMRFRDIGCSAVISVLQNCADKDELTSWTLMAVQNLGIRKENRIRMGELGACELVIAAINKHVVYSPVVKYGCMALEKLTLEPTYSALAGSCGACEAVVGAVAYHREDDMIAELGWKAIHRLARDNYDNCRRLAEAKVVDIIEDSFQRFYEEEEVLEQILVAIGMLAQEPQPSLKERNFTNGTSSVMLRIHDDMIVNVPLKIQLGDVGICELLVQMLSQYTSDEAIMRASQGQSDNIGMVYLLLNAIAALSTDCSANRQKFGDNGACEKTIAAMTLHLGSEDIAAKGCAVVHALATASKVNSLKFSRLGAETVIFRVIRKNTLSKKVISAGFAALTTVFGVVAEDATYTATIDPRKAQRARRKSGIVDNTASFEIVIKILNIHQQSKNITVSGCHLLHALIVASVAVGSGEILADLLPGSGSGKVIKLSPASFLGIAQTLVRSINLFPNSTRVCRLVCMTMSEVAVELTCSGTLGGLGGCESIVSCLKRHTDVDRQLHDHLTAESNQSDESGSVAVVKYSLRAIYCLAAEDSNMQRLRSCHAGSHVVNAIKCFCRHEGIVKAGCLALVALAQDRLHRREIMICDGYICIVGSIKCFQSNALIVEYGLTSLSKLLADSENTITVGAEKTCRLLVSTMGRYRSCTSIVKICCTIIIALCAEEVCQIYLGNVAADMELLLTLQHYAQDEALSELCCIAISRLGHANKSICSADVPYGQDLGSVLLDTLASHSDNRSLVANSLQVVTNMINIFPEVLQRFCGRRTAGEAVEAECGAFFHTLLVTVIDRYILDPPIVELATGVVKCYMTNCRDDLMFLYRHDSMKSIKPMESEECICLANVVASLNEYIDHKDVVGNCLGIIDAMLSFAVEQRMLSDAWRSFEVDGLCECVLVNCLERYMSTYTVALYCCRIVKNVAVMALASGGRSRILRDLSVLNASGSIMHTLRIYRSDEDGFVICAACCAAMDNIFEISTEGSICKTKREYCGVVVEMLRKYTSSKGGSSNGAVGEDTGVPSCGTTDMRHRLIITALATSLCILVGAEEDRQILIELGVCDVVGPILLSYKLDSAIMEKALQIVLSMSSEECITSYLGQVNICEGVTSALCQHMEVADIVRCACWACMNLSVEDENKVRLHDAGACGIFLDVLRKYGSDDVISELALGAVVNLADGNDENKSALCTHNILEIILDLLRRTVSTTILEMTFMTIVNLSEDQHKESITALSNTDLFSLVIKHMRENENNEGMVEQGCWMIKNMSIGNIENAVDWGRLGACAVVLNCMRHHFVDSQRVAVQGCAAISCLLGMDNHGSLTRSNIQQLTGLGCFGTMTLAMSVHSTDEEVVESSCVAISRFLSFHSDEETEYVENHLDRITLIHESVSGALLSHYVNAVISERCCQILSDIYSRDQYGLGKIRDWTSCCDGAVSALRAHYKLENVLLESALLMKLLSRHSKEAQNIIGLTGGGEKVVTALLHYTQEHSARAAQLRVMCLDLILVLCKGSDAVINHMGRNGVCEAIVKSLQCVVAASTDGDISDSIEFIASSCTCIIELCLSVVNRNSFLTGGAVSVLCRALTALSVLSSISHSVSASSGDDDDSVAPLTACNLCCVAILTVCGSGIDDITLFGGADLPLTLIKCLSDFSPNDDEPDSSQCNISAWTEFAATCLRIVRFVLSMRHSRRRNDTKLHENAFQLLKHHINSATIIAIFAEIVGGVVESEGRTAICALSDCAAIVESAIAKFELSKECEMMPSKDVVVKLRSLIHDCVL